MDEIFPSFVPLSKVIVAGKLTDAPLIQSVRDAYSSSPNEKQATATKQAFFWRPVAPKPSQFYPRSIEPVAPAPPVVYHTPERNGARGIASYFGRTSELTALSPITSPSVERYPSPEYVRPPPSKYQRRIEMIERDDRREEHKRNKWRSARVREEDIEATPSSDEELERQIRQKYRKPCRFIDDEADVEDEPVRKRRRPMKPVQTAQRKKQRKVAVSSSSEDEGAFSKYLRQREGEKAKKTGLINPYTK
jgi:hypothetical protein